MRYLIVTYIEKPNGKYDETVEVGTKVNNRAQSMASVILDYKDRKVVKSRMNGNNERPDNAFDTLHEFYKKHYSDLIKTIEQFHTLDTALDVAVEKVNAKIEAAHDIESN